MLGLYKQMSDVDTKMTGALSQAIDYIDISWSAGNRQDWNTGFEYAGKADSAIAEAKRLQTDRNEIINEIRAIAGQ